MFWAAFESPSIQILPPCFEEISSPFENFKETDILTLSELFDSKINILMELFNSVEWKLYSPYRVILMVTEWINNEQKGVTFNLFMRRL